MKDLKIKDLVKNTFVKFAFYRAGFMYYNVDSFVGAYQFPVPIDDTGEATFKADDKAITFMRYIRKAKENGTLIKLVK